MFTLMQREWLGPRAIEMIRVSFVSRVDCRSELKFD